MKLRRKPLGGPEKRFQYATAGAASCGHWIDPGTICANVPEAGDQLEHQHWCTSAPAITRVRLASSIPTRPSSPCLHIHPNRHHKRRANGRATAAERTSTKRSSWVTLTRQGTPRDEHAQLRWSLVESFRAILADPMQRAATTRACLRIWFDHCLFARQMRRKVTAIGAARFRRLAFVDRVGFLGLGVLEGEGGLHVVEREVQLIGADLLGRAPEARAAQRARDMGVAFVLRLEAPVLVGEGRILDLQERLVGGKRCPASNPPAKVAPP